MLEQRGRVNSKHGAADEDVRLLAKGLPTPSISSFFCSATRDGLGTKNEEVAEFK